MEGLITSQQTKPQIGKYSIVLLSHSYFLAAAVAQTIEGLSSKGLYLKEQTEDFREFQDLLRKFSPRIAVIDFSHQEFSYINSAEIIRRTNPRISLLFISRINDPAYARQFLGVKTDKPYLNSGANGYISVDASKNDLEQALLSLSQNRAYIPPEMQRHFLENLGCNTSQIPNTLTRRELEVFLLLGHGHSVKEIASTLNIAEKSVESYRTNAGCKLTERLKGHHLAYYAARYCLLQDLLRDGIFKGSSTELEAIAFK